MLNVHTQTWILEVGDGTITTVWHSQNPFYPYLWVILGAIILSEVKQSLRVILVCRQGRETTPLYRHSRDLSVSSATVGELLLVVWVDPLFWMVPFMAQCRPKHISVIMKLFPLLVKSVDQLKCEFHSFQIHSLIALLRSKTMHQRLPTPWASTIS